MELLISDTFQIHNYLSVESENEDDENDCKESQMAESSIGQTVTVKNEADLDPAWQRPITLKVLKKKLFEIFTKK